MRVRVWSCLLIVDGLNGCPGVRIVKVWLILGVLMGN